MNHYTNEQWNDAAMLCAEDYAFFTADETGKLSLHLLCNDFFGPAADCETIPIDQAGELLRRFRERGGYDAMMQFIAEKRGIKCEYWKDRLYPPSTT